MRRRREGHGKEGECCGRHGALQVIDHEHMDSGARLADGRGCPATHSPGWCGSPQKRCRCPPTQLPGGRGVPKPGAQDPSGHTPTRRTGRQARTTQTGGIWATGEPRGARAASPETWRRSTNSTLMSPASSSWTSRAADEATVHAVMAGLGEAWATSGITPVRREPGAPGVKARVYADIRCPGSMM
ncbi:DUF6207 family protein [Streptomyces sp. NPDC055287]